MYSNSYQIGIVMAAPNDEAIMLAMNFERSTGGIQTAAIGWIAGHEAPKKVQTIKFDYSFAETIINVLLCLKWACLHCA